MWFSVKKGLPYFLFSRHKKGHAIHSPFVFDLIEHVFCDEKPYEIYDAIEQQRKQWLKSNEILTVVDYGAKGKGREEQKKLSNVVKRSTMSAKYGKLLFRLVNYYKPATIIEIGTCVGVGTAYLSAGNPQARVITLEGSEAYIRYAQVLWKSLSLKNIMPQIGTFEALLPNILNSEKAVDFVFFDGNHTYDATMKYYSQCLEKVHEKTVFVFDDIYWSKEMCNAWKEICRCEKARLTIDIYRMGLVFFNNDILVKQHFTIRF
jgi:predicted O-methyltransferase YrrM